jgi:8-oxo-dGTP pyrophosphatase MutT (NUDIX family)
MPNNNKVYRAGTIPYYFDEKETIQMLFMKPSDPKFGGSEFQIAKGKVEDGEETEYAAIREASEELGLFRGNIIKTKHVGQFLGRTTVFIAEVSNPDMFGLPHYETGETTWMNPEEFDTDGRSLHRPLVRAAVRAIKREHGIDVEAE